MGKKGLICNFINKMFPRQPSNNSTRKSEDNVMRYAKGRDKEMKEEGKKGS